MNNNIKLKIGDNHEIECYFEENTILSYVSLCPQIESVFTLEDLKEMTSSDEEIKNHKDWYSIEIKELINNGFSFKITPIKHINL